MAGGRPKVLVPPCKFCDKQFRRQEHLLRHERTHTREKPFACDCGQSFTRQDLLVRHSRLSHGGQGPAIISVATASVPNPASSTPFSDGDLSDQDLFVDPNFLTPNMLPAMLFRIPPQPCNASVFSSQLPVLDDPKIEDYANDEAQGYVDPYATPSFISETDYQKLGARLQQYSDILPQGSQLPSRWSLSVYVEKYLICVQEFLPFIHTATFAVVEKDTELLLAVAALGSLYKFNRPNAYMLYSMAKAIMMETMRHENLEMTSDLLIGQGHAIWQKRNDLSKMQTLILLLIFSSWADKRVSLDAMSLGSQLAVLVRQNGISEMDEQPDNIDWLSWVATEERRRTLYAAYVTFNMLSTAFDAPPLILNHEIQIYLPSFAKRWRARDSTQWRDAPRNVERPFRETFLSLFTGTSLIKNGTISAFSNYILVHALLQQIFIDRHGSIGLQPGIIDSFETALRTWKLSWEHTFEATLDPLMPKGPLGLAGITLFRLAYIRLSSDYGSCRGVLSRDPKCILVTRPTIQRAHHVDRAVLHAIHALAIPMRLGAELVGSTKTPVWTTEHSLCSLECALLLKDWLDMIAKTSRSGGTEELRPVEKKLLAVLAGIIKESTFSESLEIQEDDESHISRMGRIVINLWAHIFEGTHLYEIDNFVGTSLQLLADSNPN